MHCRGDVCAKVTTSKFKRDQGVCGFFGFARKKKSPDEVSELQVIEFNREECSTRSG